MTKLIEDTLNVPTPDEQIKIINDHIQKNKGIRGRYVVRRMFQPDSYGDQTLAFDGELLAMWDEKRSSSSTRLEQGNYNSSTGNYERFPSTNSNEEITRVALIFYSEEGEIARLSNQLHHESNRHGEKYEVWKAKRKELEDQIVEFAQTKERLHSIENSLESAKKRVNELMEKNRKYEEDISKFRSAVGELKWKEIIQ